MTGFPRYVHSLAMCINLYFIVECRLGGGGGGGGAKHGHGRPTRVMHMHT